MSRFGDEGSAGKITDRCDLCYGFHKTDEDWNKCWADEDAYSAELDRASDRRGIKS